MELPSKNDFQAFTSSRKDSMNRLIAQIDNPKNAAALANNDPGAKQNNTAWKNEVQRVNKEMRDYNDKLGHIQHTIEREHTEISNNVSKTKKETNELVGRIIEDKDIVNLRKEQADELKTKYGANIHTSYLGLWRPLHPETHAILYTISIVLGLVSIGALVMFLFRNGFPAINFASTAAETNSENTGTLLGGAIKNKIMKLLRKK
jgi:hypothetical protein